MAANEVAKLEERFVATNRSGGARNKLQEIVQLDREKKRAGEVMLNGLDELEDNLPMDAKLDAAIQLTMADNDANRLQMLRQELFEIRGLLD